VIVSLLLQVETASHGVFYSSPASSSSIEAQEQLVDYEKPLDGSFQYKWIWIESCLLDSVENLH